MLLQVVKQWGLKKSNNNTNPITLPIACNEIKVAFAQGFGGHFEHGGSCSDYTSTTMHIQIGQGINSQWYALCIQQWGNSKGSSNNFTITFPISFATNFLSGSATFTDTYGDRLYCACLSSPTKTTMMLSSGSSNKTIYWTAVGVQQWGSTPTTKNTHTITFPIAFSNGCYTLAQCGKYSTGVISDHVANVNILSQTQFKIGTIENGAYWVAFGVQQWGFHSQSGQFDISKSFPIAFSNTVYNIIGCTKTNNTNGWWAKDNIHHSYYGVTNTNFRVSQRNDSYSYGFYYIACGVQQWVFLASTTKNKTTTFDMPLSVASVYHLTMEANVHRGDNAFVNGHAFVSHNGNASVTIGESDYGSAKWWYAVCLAQQWSYVQATDSKNVWTFPVALSNFVIITNARHYNYSLESTADVAVYEYGLTSVTLLRTAKYTNGIFVLAIGI